jgi:predicted enzyme related to lactoylglutathione lyase
MVGEPTHIEIGVPDGGRASAFYRELLGWEVTPMGGDNFLTGMPALRVGIHTGDEARIMEVFFAVPDLDAAVRKVADLGGEVSEMRDGGDFGRFAECADDQGVHFGLHEQP